MKTIDQNTSSTKPWPRVGTDGNEKYRSFNTKQIEKRNDMQVKDDATI